MPISPLALLALAACSPGEVKLDDGDDTAVGHDSADSGDTDTDTDTDSDSDSDTDTDTDTDTEAAFSDLTAEIHPVVESIVVLTWTQAGSASVHAEYSFDDGVWLQSPSWDLGDGAHRLLLLGAPYESDVTWRLVADGAPVADDDAITTGDLPDGLPTIDHVSGDDSAWDADTPWIFTCLAPGGGSAGNTAWSFILDRQGRMVWALEAPSQRTSFAAQGSVDGHTLLIDHNSWWGAFDGGVNSQVVRYDIEATELATYDTPGLIHPFTELGDGSLVWGASQGTSGRSGETLDILDPGGSPRTLLDCNDYARDHGEDVCGSNAMHWDEATDHILFSLYSAETVLEVNRDGDVVNQFGSMSGSWTFADPASTFYWQHGAHMLDNGHLLVSTRVDSRTNETVVREYELDAANRRLTEVWSFGEGEGVWAYILGEPRRLPGGNTLHNYGSTPRIREATPDGEVVWDVSWDDSYTIGRMTRFDDLYALWSQTP